MQAIRKRLPTRQTLCGFLLLLVLSTVVSLISYRSPDGHLLPSSIDTYGLACGVENVRDGGSFFSLQHPIQFFESYPVCWAPTYLVVLTTVTALSFLTTLPGLTVASLSAPLLVFAIGLLFFRIFRLLLARDDLGWILALLSVLTPSITRSASLTPHNLFGYVLILVFILFLIRFHQSSRMRDGAGMVLSYGMLLFTHSLSFFLLTLTIAAALLLQGWREPKRFAQFLLFFFVLLVGYVIGNQISFIHEALNSFQAELAFHQQFPPSSLHPWWNHPFAWGMILTLLGFFGIGSLRKARLPLLSFWFAFLLVAALLAHGNVVGFSVVPGRIVAYAFIPLLIFGGVALQQLQRQRPAWFPVLLVLLFSSSMIVAVQHHFSNRQSFGASTQPSEALLEAEHALQSLSNTSGALLTIIPVDDRALRTTPVFYRGPNILYPEHLLKRGETLEPKEGTYLYWLFLQNKLEVIQPLQTLFEIIQHPRAKESMVLLKKMNIQYILLPTSHRALKQKIEGGDGSLYAPRFENASYAIYEYKKYQ